MNRVSRKTRLPLLATLAWLVATPGVSTEGEGPLAFLGRQDATEAWVMNSGFDPALYYGLTFDPPWVLGDDSLSRIDLSGSAPRLEPTPPLAASGTVMTLALSPDGDTALVSTLGPNQILVVRGLREGWPRLTATLPLNLFALSLDVAPDGRSAVAGLQRNGPGGAVLTLLEGLPDRPRIREVVHLGIAAESLSAVESVDFSADGRRILAQTALHRFPDPPLFFLPDVVLQVVSLGAANVAVSEPFPVPAEPFLSPQPPFTGLETGRALGDSAILCDGDTALVPSPGALNLGQPDARILLLRGVRSGHLELERTLTLLDGVGIAPLQITVGADCSAWVTNTFDGTVTRYRVPSSNPSRPSLESHPIGYPFPSEPAVTPDGDRLLVHHPRPPLDGVPPAAVTVVDSTTGEPLGPPLTGPVVAWVEVKDGTLATHPPGLIDYLEAFSRAGHETDARRLIATVERAMALAAKGHSRAAYGSLSSFVAQVRALRKSDRLREWQARLFVDLASSGLRVLFPPGSRRPGLRW